MTISIPIKNGDTFVLQCVVSVDGVVVDITGWTINSKVKLASANFEDSLVVTKIDAVNGVYQLKKQDTTAWPAGTNPKNLICDVQYILANGNIISTENFTIACVNGVT